MWANIYEFWGCDRAVAAGWAWNINNVVQTMQTLNVNLIGVLQPFVVANAIAIASRTESETQYCSIEIDNVPTGKRKQN